MTPERAREIVCTEAWLNIERSGDSMTDTAVRAILAACAEERRAALTEAAEVVRHYEYAPIKSLQMARHQILAMRDKEGA